MLVNSLTIQTLTYEALQRDVRGKLRPH